MRSSDFFATHPVFTHAEFVEARASRGATLRTADNLLAGYCGTGAILRVRRGLYAVVPRGVAPDRATVDPYLVATRLTPDAVLALHAALQFHGKAYSVWRRFHYVTGRRARPFTFQGQEFVPVQVSRGGASDVAGGVVETRHAGGTVRVTSLERTLVDVLHAPEKVGGWEETWRSLEMVEFFDLDVVIAHVASLGSALTAARVGFFLEQHRQELMVEEAHLAPLRALAPSQPRYLDSRRSSGRLVAPWNLIVPESVLKRTWEEEASWSTAAATGGTGARSRSTTFRRTQTKWRASSCPCCERTWPRPGR